MSTKGILLYLFLLMILFSSCDQTESNMRLAENPISNNTPKDLSEVESFVGHGAGEATLKSSCLTCHSLRYIQMQPPFPKKTWEKIVDKMVKNFGAPISDSSAKVIVSYLSAVKGK